MSGMISPKISLFGKMQRGRFTSFSTFPTWHVWRCKKKPCKHEYLPGLISKPSCPCRWCEEPGVGEAGPLGWEPSHVGGPLGWEPYKHEYLPRFISKPSCPCRWYEEPSVGRAGPLGWEPSHVGGPLGWESMNTYPVLSASPAAPVGDVGRAGPLGWEPSHVGGPLGWEPYKHEYLPRFISKPSCPCRWYEEPCVGRAGPLGWEPSHVGGPLGWESMNTYPVLSASPAAPVHVVDVKSLVWRGLVPWGGRARILTWSYQ